MILEWIARAAGFAGLAQQCRRHCGGQLTRPEASWFANVCPDALLAVVLSIAGCVACGRSPRDARPEPIVTPLPIVTPIDEPFQAPSFTTTVRGHGRPVILIPGLGLPGVGVGIATVAHLANNAETHVVELAARFAGRPAIAGPLEATARIELAHYIRQNHLDHPVLIGHSLGGFLALWLASTEPDLVTARTIVVDAAPSIGNTFDAQAAHAISGTWRTSERDRLRRRGQRLLHADGQRRALARDGDRRGRALRPPRVRRRVRGAVLHRPARPGRQHPRAGAGRRAVG